MATYRSGHGGFVQISFDGVTYTQLDVATWTLTRGKRLTERTSSASGGSSAYHKVVNDHSWRLEFPWDEDNLELYEEMDSAEHLWIKFKHGSGQIRVTLSETSIETYETVDNNVSDIVRAVMSGKGGILT